MRRRGRQALERWKFNSTTTEAETATTTGAETASRQGKKKKAIEIPGKYTHKKRDNAHSVDGAELELANSRHCASWIKMRGHIQRPSKWKGS